MTSLVLNNRALMLMWALASQFKVLQQSCYYFHVMVKALSSKVSCMQTDLDETKSIHVILPPVAENTVYKACLPLYHSGRSNYRF